MSDFLKCVVRNIEKYAQDASFVALKSYEGTVKFRIHNRGGATKGQIGDYQTDYWKKKRIAAGRQVGYVDLEMTGQLRRDLTTGQSKGVAVLGFKTDRSKTIHDGQTDRRGKKIWRPNTVEIRDMQDIFKEDLYDKIRGCL